MLLNIVYLLIVTRGAATYVPQVNMQQCLQNAVYVRRELTLHSSDITCINGAAVIPKQK
jgi:hypothetical protein